MNTPIIHYYGDIVRKLFLAGAVIMLLAYPFFRTNIPLRPAFTIIAVALLSVMAGLTSPKERWTSAVDALIALGAVITFEYYAVKFAAPQFGGLFVANQLLALTFLVALYFAVKTFRGMVASLPEPPHRRHKNEFDL